MPLSAGFPLSRSMARSNVLQEGKLRQPVFSASWRHTFLSSSPTVNGAGLCTPLNIVETLACDSCGSVIKGMVASALVSPITGSGGSQVPPRMREDPQAML